MKRVWGILGSALFVLVVLAVAYRVPMVKSLVTGNGVAKAA